MAAAAIPIGASLLAPEAAGALAAIPGLAGVASAAPWLLPAVAGAGMSGIGSLLTGSDPLKGALMGGIGGGIGSLINGGGGLSGMFGGGINPSAADTAGALSQAGVNPGIGQAFNAAGDSVAMNSPEAVNFGVPSSKGLIYPTASAAAPATSAASGSPFSLSKAIIPIGGALAAGMLDNSNKPKTLGPPLKEDLQSKPVAALNRTQQEVDPRSYLTAGGNRSFYNNYDMQTRYLARGGKARGFANGGSSSANSSNIPSGGISRYVKGRGDGQSDDIPAMLSDGEFVFSAPAVSALGNGSNDAGAKKLAKMQKTIIHKHYKGSSPRKSGGIGSYVH